METILSYLAAASCVGLVILCWRVLNWVWVRPKKLECILRKQGFNGNSYRILHGDLKEMKKMMEDASSNPINLSDDILPRVQPFYVKTVQKYGKNSFMWMGPTPVLLVNDPEFIKEVFFKNYQFHMPQYTALLKYFLQGLVTYEGDKWAKHRKIMNPAFHSERLKHMLPAFYWSCTEMLSKWDEIASANGSSELDVWPYFQNLTGDTISRAAFGSNYEEGRKIFELQREQSKHFIQAATTIYIPGMRFLPTKRNKRMKEIAREVQALVKGIIDKRIKAMKEGEARVDDLLSILLEYNFKEIEEHGNNQKYGMSIPEIIEECKLFYFAGQESTAVLILWTMILLSKHPEWQERARDEVLQTLRHDKPDYDELIRLKTVTMILHEVLRLYPPAIALTRRSVQDYTLGKELSLPSGVHIQMPIILLHHDPEIWGIDSKEFKPERFREGVSKATKGKLTYFPFGAGPRICIGQNFALLEAKLVLAMILQRFSFELSPSYAHAPFAIANLEPQYGAHLILRKL